MFDNFFVSDKIDHNQNLISQVVEILAEKISNTDSLKFISQMKTGNIFDAVFSGKTGEGKGVLSLEGNNIVVELPKAIPSQKQPNQSTPLNKQPEKATRAPLFKGQTIRVRVESSWPKPTLKIIQPALQQGQPENPETRTILTHRAKSISSLSRVEDFFQTTNLPKNSVKALITRILDSKSIMVDTGSRNIVVPVKNSELMNVGEKVDIFFENTEKGHNPRLVNTSTTNIKPLDIKTIIPYLSGRMPLVRFAHLLMDEVLGSPVMQELNINLDVVTRLRDTLILLIPRKGETPSEVQVRQQVESSGVNYEAKIRQAFELGLPVHKEVASDLKGLLLNLYQSADKAWQTKKRSEPLSEFRQTIKFAIDNIEFNQLSSNISKQENQPLVIQIPNPLSSGNQTIQLYIRKDSLGEESKDKKSSHNVAFFLDLSFLGKIKINAQIGKERLSLRIDVESEGVANFVRDKAEVFKEKMKESNIETSVECCVIGQVKPIKDNLIEMLISQNTSLVNIKT
jgi:hypothetical protein